MQWLSDQLLAARVLLLILGHLILFAGVFWLSFLLRFDFAVPRSHVDVFRMTVFFVICIKLAVFYVTGHFHGWWRYVSFADLAGLLRASAASLIVLATADHFLFPYQVPRSILILDCLVGIIALGALRSGWRLYQEHFWPMLGRGDDRRALLVGATVSTGRLAHQIHAHPELQYRIRGFLTTNGVRVGSRLGHIPVLGTLEEAGKIAAKSGVTDVLVTAGSLPGPRMRKLMEDCTQAELNLKIIPPIEDLFSGDHRLPMRDIDIDDLLHRDPIVLDNEAIEGLIEGRTVMVTGAGGSIGSEICRQVMKFNPHSLVLVGKGENRIFFIDRELQRIDAFTEIHARIGDVTDEARMRQLFEEHHPDVIFHAAAHKHVPMMEANVGEAVKNNIRGTKCVAELAHEYEAGSFVLVSTDKAVHPSSVMGTTKHIAERYVHTLSQESSTRFIVTRFGNVLGSRGSVVPLFREQIRRGGPITVTDEQMTRYFMTIPEASQLVLQAAAMGRGGEIFVLDMGEPVRIVDLAHDLIRLSGLPKDAIEIVFSGVRPGEKLYEELYFEDEETLPTAHPKLRAAYHRPHPLAEVRQSIDTLLRLAHGPEAPLREKLHQLVPEYSGFSSSEPPDGDRRQSEDSASPSRLPRRA